MVIFQKGMEWLVDPCTGSVIKYNLIGLFENELIKEAKAFANGFALLTDKNRFLFVRNAYQPQCIEFANCEE